MPQRLRETRRVAVGVKEVMKAVNANKAQLVYIADDADQVIIGPLKSAVYTAGIELVAIDSMRLLGRLCEIEVGAATAALLKE